MRAAIQFAIDNGRKSVTLVHKGNIMKFTEGAFKTWGYELAEREFGDKVYTWSQYDKVLAKQGQEVADAQQKAALDGGKILIKDSIADAFLHAATHAPQPMQAAAANAASASGFGTGRLFASRALPVFTET